MSLSMEESDIMTGKIIMYLEVCPNKNEVLKCIKLIIVSSSLKLGFLISDKYESSQENNASLKVVFNKN